MDNEFVWLEVNELRLDPENPRLPVDLQGSSQQNIVEFLFHEAALSDLAQSMLDNGFFDHEPLIVVEAEAATESDYQYTVVEGNRRLATLQILLEEPAADEYSFTFDDERDDKSDLEVVPCVLVDSKSDVHDFLGYRHISGLEAWSSEAKARYLYREVEKVQSNVERPFRVIARRTGSNARGIRNFYISYVTLREAESQYDLNVHSIRDSRFSVWRRLLNDGRIREFLGGARPKTYNQVQEWVDCLDEETLGTIVHHVTPTDEGGSQVLQDSRRANDLAKVIANDRAREILAETRNLDAALRVVEKRELPKEFEELKEELDALREQVAENPEPLSSRDKEKIADVVRSMKNQLAMIGVLVEGEA